MHSETMPRRSRGAVPPTREHCAFHPVGCDRKRRNYTKNSQHLRCDAVQSDQASNNDDGDGHR